MIVVVKLGTSVLTGGAQRLDRAHMVELVRQCALLQKNGHRVIVVTSGAVAAGRELLGFPHLPLDLPHKQMLAAIGQGQLVQLWQHLFGLYGLNVGQMLLTRADLEDRERFLNARDTLGTLLSHGVIPLINENDAVATNEIKVGDNDNLSARVAILAKAELLLLLTDQPGLFTADPRANPHAELIAEVQTIDATLHKLAGGSVSGLGTGGMATKLQAADVARRAGITVVIASGQGPDVIRRLVQGERIGTRFTPIDDPLENRKQWILAGPPAVGQLHLDQGAVKAVLQQGASLLPKGVHRLDGHFQRGDAVRLLGPDGAPLAVGLCRYSAEEMAQILGLHSDAITMALGYDRGPVAVHRDDLVLL